MSSPLNRDYPELLTDLMEQLESRLREGGVAPDIAKKAAEHATEHIRGHWGGCHLYIPKGDLYDLQARDYQIYSKFTGGNYIDLAREYDLSEMRIRIIVKAVRAQERERRQLKMFS